MEKNELLDELLSQYNAVRKKPTLRDDPKAAMMTIHVGATLLQAAHTASIAKVLKNLNLNAEPNQPETETGKKKKVAKKKKLRRSRARRRR